MGYPCWRYHRTEPPVIVNDSVEEAALGDGWADTPAKFAVPEKAPEKPKRIGRSRADGIAINHVVVGGTDPDAAKIVAKADGSVAVTTKEKS